MPTPSTLRRIKVAERQAQVVQWHADGMSFPAIGRELGVTPQRAHQIFKRALEKLPAAGLEEHRARHLALTQACIREQLDLARDQQVSPRTRIEAYSGVRGYLEREASLLGLNAPVRKEITVLTDDVISAAIERLKADAAVWDAEVVEAIEA